MAAFIYLAKSGALDKPIGDMPNILLDSSPEYWFLYRYLEAANLDHGNELIDLYGGRVIEGYQLHRLRTELDQARLDVDAKPEAWNVLVGWTGGDASVETEDWQQLTKSSAIAVIESLLSMIRCSTEHDLKLVSSGD